MTRALLACAVGLVALIGSAAVAQPEGGKKGSGDKKGPPGFELGKVLPPHFYDQLDLTDAQMQKIRALEKDVRMKLESILTADQIKTIRDREPKGKKDGNGKGPPRKEGGPNEKGDKQPGGKTPNPQRIPPEKQTSLNWDGGAIQWFGTWKQGLAEAQRSGRPILLVSAAPHCSGVSGVW